MGKLEDYDEMILELYDEYRNYVRWGDYKDAEMVWRAIEKLDRPQPKPNSKERGGK